MQDPFVLALRKIEFESGRAMQAQILLLKSADLLPLRDAVNAAVESRHLRSASCGTTCSPASVWNAASRDKRSIAAAVTLDTDQRSIFRICGFNRETSKRRSLEPRNEAVSAEEAVAMIPTARPSWSADSWASVRRNACWTKWSGNRKSESLDYQQ